MADQTVTLRITANAQGLVTGVALAKREMQGLGAAGQKGGEQVASGMAVARRGVESISRQLRTLQNLASVWAAFAGVRAVVRDLVATADAMTSMNARLRLATDGAAAYAQAQRDVQAIAASARADLESVATLYTRLSQASGSLGVSQTELAEITEAVSLATTLSGGSAQTAAAGVTQLAQAFASGVLSGDEFRSVMENSPRVVQALTDTLGVSVGELRRLANEQRLTSDIVAQALQLQLTTMQAEMAGYQATVGQALGQMNNAWSTLVASVNEAHGVTNALATSLGGITALLQAEAEAARAGGGAMEVLSNAINIAVIAGVAFKNGWEAIVTVVVGSVDIIAKAASAVAQVLSNSARTVIAYKDAILSLDVSGAWDALAQGARQHQGIVSRAAGDIGASFDAMRAGVEEAHHDIAHSWEVLTSKQARAVTLTQEQLQGLRPAFGALADAWNAGDVGGLVASAKAVGAALVDAASAPQSEIDALRARVAELLKQGGAAEKTSDAQAAAARKLADAWREHEQALRPSLDAMERIHAASADLDEQILQARERLAGLTDAQVQYSAALRAANAEAELALKLGPPTAENQKAMAERLRKLAELQGLSEANEALAQYVQHLKELGMTYIEVSIKIHGLDGNSISDALWDAVRASNTLRDALAGAFAATPAERLRAEIDALTAALKIQGITAEDSAAIQAQLEARRQTLLENNAALVYDGIEGLKSMAGEGTKAYAALEVAQTALNLATAIGAIANQGTGDPYTAFARIAAMAALMSQLVSGLGSVRGGFSGGAAEQQATQGTGSVLGDTAAKSDSIARAVEITARATEQLVGINRGMLRALTAMQAGLSGASRIIAGGDDAEFSELGAAPLNAATSIGVKITNLLTGGLLGGFLGELTRKLIGARQKVTDGGIQIVGGTLAQLIEDISVGAYRQVQSRSWWFGSTRTSTEVESLGADIEAQLQLVLNSMADAVRAGAEALGLNMDQVNAAIDAYRIEEIRISTMGLSAEETQKELEAVFSRIFDGLAGAIVPWIGEFQKVGEGLGETLVRVATGVQVMQEAVKQLGFALDVTDPLAFARISEGLIELMGGIEGFMEGMSTFVTAFATDEHKFAVAQDALTSAFAQFGLTVPETRDGMWALMQSLDATTEEGREQIAMLLQLAGVADSYYALLEDLEADRLRKLAAYAEFIDQFRPDQTIGTGADSATLAAAEAQAAVWVQHMIEQANALAVAAGLAGAAEEDLALIHARAAEAVAAAQERLQSAYDSFIDQFRPDDALPTGADAATMEQALAESAAWVSGMIEQANALAVAAGLAGASEEDLALIHARAAEYVAAAQQRITEAMAKYDEAVQGLRDELDAAGMSEFAIAMRDIHRWTLDTTASLNDAARAAGLQAAREEDLALVHQVAAQRAAAAIAQLRAEAAALVTELFGPAAGSLDDISAQIAALEGAAGQIETGAASAGQAVDDLFERWLRGVQSVQDYLDSMLLGDLSALTPEQQLAEAQRQLEAAQAAALGGDADALANLPQLADAYLRMVREFEASGQDYTDQFDWVRSLLQQVAGLPNPGSPTAGGGGGGGVYVAPSPELEALYAERDRLLAEQEAAHRLELMDQLGQMVRELIQATGEPLADVAASIGLNLSDLTAELGINLSNMTAETALSLVGLARSLGVDVAELASNVGVSLGGLADRQSLLNQALDQTLAQVPDSIRDQLLAPLDAIRSATSEADANAALAQLEQVTDGLPAGIRDLLAPYFANIDPAPITTELTRLSDIAGTAQAQLAAAQQANALLQRVADNLRESNASQGLPAYAAGGWVNGPTTLLAGEAGRELILPNPVSEFFQRAGIPVNVSGGDNRALIDELRRLGDKLDQIERSGRGNAQELATVIDATGQRSDRELDQALSRHGAVSRGRTA